MIMLVSIEAGDRENKMMLQKAGLVTGSQKVLRILPIYTVFIGFYRFSDLLNNMKML